MDLFSNHINLQTAPINLLPSDGEAHYYGRVFHAEQAEQLFQDLLHHIAWQHDRLFIYGRHIRTKRQYAWYGDKPYLYTYSNITREACLWHDLVLPIKNKVEQLSGDVYNACLLNLYHDGSEGMSWHSDAEPEIKPCSPIASVSFGAERRFVFKHKKTGRKAQLILEQGSVLVMRGETQQHWQHALPVSKQHKSPRINLTFRVMAADCPFRENSL